MKKNYYLTGSIIGILAATIVDWLLMGNSLFKLFILDQSFNLKNSLPILIAIAGQFTDFFAWAGKPLIWLMMVGAPASLVIGSVYYFIQTKRS